MRRPAVGAVVAVALGVAACGSTNTAQTTPSSRTATVSGASGAATTALPSSPDHTGTGTIGLPATTGATTPTTASATTAPATVTTETITAPDSGGAGLTGSSATASSECVAADLSAAAVPPNSAPGITVVGFTLKNISGRACESGAYPGVGLISASDDVEDVTTTRTTSDDLGATPVTRIDLAPGEEMSFRITLHDAGAGTGAGCADFTGVQIIAPNDTATMRVSVPDAPVQSCGSVGVSPVEPGTNGTGQ